eukprot:PhF_6_TR20135/c0_g1_i1/m.29264/K05290/PIGK; phosphatidylinositol glycan, class K
MFFVISILILLGVQADGEHNSTHSPHTNNWAVIVSTSRFWFNYRHTANALSFYHVARKNGVPDSNIVLMLSDDIPCNGRNTYPGAVYNNVEHDVNLYSGGVQVDYRGYDVTVQRFLRVLQDRWEEDVPPSKRLRSDANSNVFLFLTGHGGDGFLKFQDSEELSSVDLADAIAQMAAKNRYKNLFVVTETCQAESLCSLIRSPNVVCVASSKVGQSSYSHHVDPRVGVSVIDRFTYESLEFLKRFPLKPSVPTLQDLFNVYTRDKLLSDAFYVIKESNKKKLSDFPVYDFLANSGVVKALPRPHHVASTSVDNSILRSVHPMEQPNKNLKASSFPIETKFASPQERVPSSTIAWITFFVCGVV